MNYDVLVYLLNNHWVDFDGADGNQCFDLIQFYNLALGNQNPFTGATADLIYQQPGDFYTQILNSSDVFPIKGDIIVWNWPHAGIATGDHTDKNQFEAFEQNDPANSNCHKKLYANYDGVIGWLRPKVVLDTHGIDASNLASLQVVFNTWYAVATNQYITIGQYNQLQSQFDEYKLTHPNTPPTSTIDLPPVQTNTPITATQTSTINKIIHWLQGI